MNINKLTTILILIACSKMICLGQVIKLKPEFKYNGNEFSPGLNKFISSHDNLGLYVTNYLSKNFFYLKDSLCNKGTALVRFRINKKGDLTNIACSKSTPVILASALKKAISSSEKYWTSLPKRDVILILPVNYEYAMYCSVIHDPNEYILTLMIIRQSAS